MGSFEVVKCQPQYLLCFAVIKRENQLMYGKNIPPNTLFSIKEMLDWVKDYFGSDELTLYNCSIQHFVPQMRLVNLLV